MAVVITFAIHRFDALSAAQLYAVLKARQEVFMIEQACLYSDCDDRDADAWHVLGTDDAGTLAAYLRILPPGNRYAEPSIGRVLTTAPFRGTGLGRALVAQGLAHCARLYPDHPIRILAQEYLLRFYASFGFSICSATIDEDGILHREMLLEPAG
jgi:ElaA protein